MLESSETLTRSRHPTVERVVRRLKPSVEGFAAAAAVYSPELMLQLVTPRGIEEPPVDPDASSRRGWRRECPAR